MNELIFLLALVSCDVIDIREEHYAEHIDLFGRVLELRDCPPLSDAERWRVEFLEARITFIASWRSECRAGQSTRLHHWEAYEQLRGECDRRLNILTALRDAHRAIWFVSYRRQSLREAKRLMGDEAYNQGTYP